jgi:hypothetical protein
MIRLGMVFAAAVLMSVSAGASHAKMTMQTFPVLAGAGRHSLVHRAIRRQARPPRSADRQV